MNRYCFNKILGHIQMNQSFMIVTLGSIILPAMRYVQLLKMQDTPLYHWTGICICIQVPIWKAWMAMS